MIKLLEVTKSIEEKDLLEQIKKHRMYDRIKIFRNKLGKAHLDEKVSINLEEQKKLFDENKFDLNDIQNFVNLINRALEIIFGRLGVSTVILSSNNLLKFEVKKIFNSLQKEISGLVSVAAGPQWCETAIFNSRLQLNNIAQILAVQRPTVLIEKSGRDFVTLVNFAGVEARGQGGSKDMSKETAAQAILNQWYQKLVENTLEPKVQHEIEILRVKNANENARACLKELSDILGLPKPGYACDFIEENFTYTITCSGMLDNPIIGNTAKTKSEAEESAACAFLQEWERSLPEVASLVAKPANHIKALTKYLGIKKFVYEQYRADGKVTEPQSYYVKVFNANGEHILTGEKSTSLLKANENAETLVLNYLINNCGKWQKLNAKL